MVRGGGFRSDYSTISELQKQIFADVVGMFGENSISLRTHGLENQLRKTKLVLFVHAIFPLTRRAGFGLVSKASQVSAEIRNSRALRQKGLGASALGTARCRDVAAGTSSGARDHDRQGMQMGAATTLEYALLEKISRRCKVPIEYFCWIEGLTCRTGWVD